MNFRLLFVLSLLGLFYGCTVTFENFEKEEKLDNNDQNRKLVEVAYYTPVYAKPNQDVLKTTVIAPIPYSKAGKVITYKNYVLINKPLEGIHILDNSNPEAPENVAFLELKGNIDMAIVDDRLYADMFSALVVLDVSDMENPTLIEDFTVEEVFTYDPWWNFEPIAEVENYKYVDHDPVDHTKGIVVGWEYEVRQVEESKVNIFYYTDVLATSEAAQTLEGEAQNLVSNAGSMTRFLPVDNFLYAINQNDLLLFEISQTEKPNRWGKLGTDTFAETLFKLNDLLFVGSVSGMLMYDVSEPGNPNFLNKIDHFRSCDPVVADLNYAYVTLRGGTFCFTDRNELQIINIQDPKKLEVIATHLMFNPHGLAIYENHVIVCDGTAGIKVVDVTDRSKPKVAETYPIEFAYDVIVDYPNALVVGEEKLYQYDISELPKMKLINESELVTEK